MLTIVIIIIIIIIIIIGIKTHPPFVTLHFNHKLKKKTYPSFSSTSSRHRPPTHPPSTPLQSFPSRSCPPDSTQTIVSCLWVLYHSCCSHIARGCVFFFELFQLFISSLLLCCCVLLLMLVTIQFQR